MMRRFVVWYNTPVTYGDGESCMVDRNADKFWSIISMFGFFGLMWVMSKWM